MKNKNSIVFVSASTLAIGMTQGAIAQTTINNVNFTIGSGQVYDMNLNGDGTTNFAIRFDGKSSTDTTTWNQFNSPFVSARPQDTTDATQTTFVLGNTDPNQGGAGGFPLAGAGTTIGPDYLTPVSIGYLYQDYNGNTVGGWSSTSVSDGYVGLELTSSGGSVTNFGWVEISYDYNGGNNSTITILRDAYDATPNESLTTPALVPEPTPMALMGIAGVLLAMSRKLKNGESD
jgi:hypothetical protein